jgi:hypothetical protein
MNEVTDAIVCKNGNTKKTSVKRVRTRTLLYFLINECYTVRTLYAYVMSTLYVIE